MSKKPSRTIATTLGVAALSTATALGAAHLVVNQPAEALERAVALVRPFLVADDRPALRRLDDPEVTGSIAAPDVAERAEHGPAAALLSP